MKTAQKILKHKNSLALVSGVLIVLALASRFLFHWQTGYSAGMMVASVIGFSPIAIQAYQALKVKVISIDLLVTIAVVGAFLIGEYNESAIVTFLFLFGSYLEQKTLEKTRSAISDLTKIAPASAFRIIDGEIEEVDIDEVDKGDHLLVKTGAQVPVDGKIVSGEGYLNEASVTGEAELVGKKLGDQVFAGTILENGTLQVAAEKVGEDTTFGKIIELVEEAQDAKSEAERLIDRFSMYYTPFVLLLAAVIALVTQDIRLAITVLVLGCPGALVIGVPVSNVAGIGNGAKHGVLLKGGEVMRAFSKVDTFVFDKTGTLTYGKPSVASVTSYGADKATAISLAASVERESDHPLGQAIIDYAELSGYQNVDQTEVVKGMGVKAQVAGQDVLVGNLALMEKFGVSLDRKVRQTVNDLQKMGHSLVFVALDGDLSLLFGIKDQVRPEVKETLAQLRGMGAKQLIMLSGDNQTTAEIIGKDLGLDVIKGGLLPEDKAAFVKELKADGRVVAFVGDGINDSPSIALADIGIAMGSGTDVAIETSDVILMRSSLDQLTHAFGLTKKTVMNMKENIAIALATVFFLLLGLVFGYIYMASGMLVHELSILVVVINGMRLLAFGKKFQKLDSYQVNHLTGNL